MDTGIPRTVELHSQSDADLREASGTVADVTVTEPRVTTSHTAWIRVTLENTTTQSQSLTYIRDTCDLNLIPGRYQHEDSIWLLLISTEQDWERTKSDCWVPDGRNLNCGIPSIEHEITIPPDEPVVWSFRLWAEPENIRSDVCMPPGICEFTRVLQYDKTEAPLSFSLSIDR